MKTDKYDKTFLQSNMMGPNSMRILEELLKDVKLKKEMKVLDLGCVMGLDFFGKRIQGHGLCR